MAEPTGPGADGARPDDAAPGDRADDAGRATAAAPDVAAEAERLANAARLADENRRANEKHTQRQMWWYLAYFLFGIHLVAFIMIFAVLHGH